MEIACGRWTPILDGADRRDAVALVDTIARGVPEAMADGDASLSQGLCGAALLHAYRARAGEGADDAGAALRLLNRAVDTTSAAGRDPWLFSGFTGVAWAVGHVQSCLGIDGECVDGGIDEAVADLVSWSPWEVDNDLVHGLVGLAVYALERLPRPAAVRCLERIVDRLDETGQRTSDGIAWWTPAELLPSHHRELHPNGYHNLGVAHGMPGIIVALARIHGAGVAAGGARALLDGAVRWLLAQRLRGAHDRTFPTLSSPEGGPTFGRLAWCYGDAGVAGALLCAARCLGDGALESEAVEVARGTLRRPAAEAGVVDAGLCHGAAGLGHIYNRFHQATGDPVFADAARHWFAHVLALRDGDRGVAGFTPLRDGEPASRAEEAGFLEGASGIGLALLAAVSGVEPAWDRVLLLSS